MTGSNTGVNINFLPYKEFYIVGYESGGQIQIPDEGDSNFGLMKFIVILILQTEKIFT